MRTVAKYIKSFVCVMIVIAALVAPVTGFVPQKGFGSVIAKNQIDQSNFSGQWADSMLDFSNIQNSEPQESIHKAIWDFSSQDTPVVINDTDTQNSFADILKDDSSSGYDKLVEMARNGYADFGSQVVTSSAYRSQGPVASSQPVLNDFSGPGGRRGSGSNGYTDVPANPGDPGTKPVDPGNGGGGITDPVDPPPVNPPPVDNPVVPAPPALLLVLGGAMLVAKFKKTIK